MVTFLQLHIPNTSQNFLNSRQGEYELKEFTETLSQLVYQSSVMLSETCHAILPPDLFFYLF